MAATLDLDPLPETEWVHGEEAPTDGTLAHGDADFIVSEPITYTVAQVIEEMIAALQARRNHIQLPRWSFAFGIGTGSAAGKLKGLADNGVETFPNGFVARPVIHTPFSSPYGAIGRSEAYYLARCLKRGGTFTGTEDEVYGVVLGSVSYAWGWYWPDPFVAWVDRIYTFPWWPQELNHGITIQAIRSAGGNYIMEDAFADGPLWVIKAYKTLRRTDHAIAYVLLTELMDALEETLLGNDDALFDFGEGRVRARLSWKDPDYTEYRSGKFLIYDTDVEQIGGFEAIPLEGNPTWRHDDLKKGMEGAIMQCRGMLNDLRWVTAVEIPPVSDDVDIDQRTMITSVYRYRITERIGTDVQAPWLRWPPTGRVSGLPSEFSGVARMIPGAAVGLSVVPFAANEYEYQAAFFESSSVHILRLSHSDETEPKVVRFRLRIYPYAPNVPLGFQNMAVHRLRDPAGGRAAVELGVYADTPNGDLRRLFEENGGVLEDPAQTSYDDFRAGGRLADVDGQEFVLVLPKKEVEGPRVDVYIAMVGEATVLADTWDGWVPVTDIPPLVGGSYGNLEATTGRGYDTVFFAELELL